MMKRAFGIVLVIVLIGSFILAGCAEPEPTTTPEPTPTTTPTPTPTTPEILDLKFSYHTPPKASLVPQIYDPWTDAVEKAAGGKLKITDYGGGSLVGEADAFDAVLSGLADLAVTRFTVTPGRFPLTECISLPFLFPETVAVTSQIYHELLLKYCVDTELKEVKLLLVPCIPTVEYCGNHKLEVLEDFQGLKMPASQGVVGAWTYEALGATPVEITVVDYYTSLERGLIDGVTINPEAWLAFKLHEVTKYRTMMGGNFRATALPISMNLEVWESLPDDIKKAFEDNSRPEDSAFHNANNEALEPGVIAAIKGIDAKVGKPDWYVLPPDELARWIEVTQPIWDKWAEPLEEKGLPAKEFIQDIIDLSEEYSQ